MRGGGVQLRVGLGVRASLRPTPAAAPFRHSRPVAGDGEILSHVALVVDDAASDRLQPAANFRGIPRGRIALARESRHPHERHRRQSGEDDESDDRSDPTDLNHAASLASGIERQRRERREPVRADEIVAAGRPAGGKVGVAGGTTLCGIVRRECCRDIEEAPARDRLRPSMHELVAVRS
jgi:hypothetical protein